MNERYTKVCDLPKNMYAENAPVVISAGALFKDNQTGKMLVLLKIKNITNKTIKAAKISILSFDTVGKQIDDETTYEYLDLSVGRDYEFGQKVPIILSNNSTRSFSLTINEIIFADNSIWNYGGEEWDTIKETNKLISILSSSESLKQFKIEYGEKCEYNALEDKDIWICSCGKINKKEENKCFDCGCSLQTLKNIDWSKIEENKNIRIAKEKEQTKQAIAKRNNLIAIISAICIVVVVLSTVIFSYSKKVNTYNEGITLLQSDSFDDMNKGADMLLSLGTFKDGVEQIYSLAENLYQNKNTSKSIILYEKLGNYKDCKDKLNEILYNEGQKLFDNNQYIAASRKFSECLNYKDSEEMRQKSVLFNVVLVNDYLNHQDRHYINDLKELLPNVDNIAGQTLKTILVGDWLCRSTDETLGKKTFFENGIFTDNLYYPKQKKWSSIYTEECKWSVDIDILTTVSTMHYTGDMAEMMNKQYDDYVETFKFVKLNDDILVSYDPDDGHIQEIYISPNSEIGELCLKQYGLK